MNNAHRDWYWLALKTAWKEYLRQYQGEDTDHSVRLELFYTMCENRWGFKVEQSDHGISGISANYRVLDEAKFSLFQLKYSNV